eukprot:961712-Rhodomonas_salina.2
MLAADVLPRLSTRALMLTARSGVWSGQDLDRSGHMRGRLPSSGIQTHPSREHPAGEIHACSGVEFQRAWDAVSGPDVGDVVSPGDPVRGHAGGSGAESVPDQPVGADGHAAPARLEPISPDASRLSRPVRRHQDLRAQCGGAQDRFRPRSVHAAARLTLFEAAMLSVEC